MEPEFEQERLEVIHLGKSMASKWRESHLPCYIRFHSPPQNATSPGYDDHTAILFGCKFDKKFEFAVAYSDPLDVKRQTSGNLEISIIPKENRILKVFSGCAFTSTCYYNWDEEKRFSCDCNYVRNFYTGVDILIGDKWVSFNRVFQPKLRTLKDLKMVSSFLKGNMDDCLPRRIENIQLPTHFDFDPQYFVFQVFNRRSLPGRGSHEVKKCKKRKISNNSIIASPPSPPVLPVPPQLSTLLPETSTSQNSSNFLPQTTFHSLLENQPIQSTPSQPSNTEFGDSEELQLFLHFLKKTYVEKCICNSI